MKHYKIVIEESEQYFVEVKKDGNPYKRKNKKFRLDDKHIHDGEVSNIQNLEEVLRKKIEERDDVDLIVDKITISEQDKNIYYCKHGNRNFKIGFWDTYISVRNDFYWDKKVIKKLEEEIYKERSKTRRVEEKLARELRSNSHAFQKREGYNLLVELLETVNSDFKRGVVNVVDILDAMVKVTKNLPCRYIEYNTETERFHTYEKTRLQGMKDAKRGLKLGMRDKSPTECAEEYLMHKKREKIIYINQNRKNIDEHISESSVFVDPEVLKKYLK